MLVFQRDLESKIIERLHKKRAVLIFGPRQAGKTTLAKKILEPYGKRGEYFNCDLASVRGHFEVGRPELLHDLVGGNQIAVLDEAQTIENIGIILKTFIDTYPDTQIIATGSSSFDLANKINEPLTGRAFEFMLYPLSLKEIRRAYPHFSLSDLHELMQYGCYPSIAGEAHPGTKADLLKNLTTNYLYKDIYTFESIRHPRLFENLIKMLAHQIGSLVSINELANALGISRALVEKYIRLLEQSYVIRIVRSFSRNPRNEIKKAFKIYFIDNGIRNAVIDNVLPISARKDQGALFENYFIMERCKSGALLSFPPQMMFWRNRKGAEIDLIEESEGRIAAFECKWGSASANTHPFTTKYPEAKVNIVTPETLLNNYEEAINS